MIFFYRFWWAKLRALVEIRDWENLEKLSKSKKSPIGYEVKKKKCGAAYEKFKVFEKLT
jgi:hypothetical protein